MNAAYRVLAIGLAMVSGNMLCHTVQRHEVNSSWIALALVALAIVLAM